MRRVLRICASLAGVLAATCSVAVAQTYDSAGVFRFGVFGQYGKSHFDMSRVGFSGSTAPTGIGGGASIGYDYRFAPNWLIGIEADAAVDDTKSKTDSNRGFNSDFLSTVRARLGVNPSRTWLLYGTAGLAVLGSEYHSAPAAASTSTPNKLSETRFGWTVGGGTEVDLEGWTIFAEYLHSQFDRWSFTAPDLGIPYHVDSSSDVFRLGVKFKVGYDYDHDIYDRRARRY